MISLRQKIAQMLLIGFNGTEINESSPVSQWLLNDGLGGVILFDYDLANARQGKNLVNQMQIIHLNRMLNHFSHNSATGKQLPLFIAIDYEGGAVDRLAKIEGCMQTKSPEQAANLPSGQKHAYWLEMAETLKFLGFNLNFAPVVDLNLTTESGIIGRLGRSFGAGSQEVVKNANEFVKIFADLGITCCYKHFPGHGSASGDTHLGFVDVTDTFDADELVPYTALSQSDEATAMIMTAHVINRNLDPDGLPATLSKPILSGLLRQQLGFDGVIISDDLQMKAISDHYPLKEALAMTINAGADMVIIANQLGEISAPEVIDTIVDLVNDGVITVSRIEQAFARIARLKQTQSELA
ncbi:glycoside hydrolase family 3 protein [Legionella dresdenensis]|uniref:beta-N-acetylhexosaminidase n=1 Tax=Legionella dresdenensis TaxID=450200 RepID=A0ABV8CBU4_9GAMM